MLLGPVSLRVMLAWLVDPESSAPLRAQRGRDCPTVYTHAVLRGPLLTATKYFAAWLIHRAYSGGHNH
jgi:hypothetical protein